MAFKMVNKKAFPDRDMPTPGSTLCPPKMDGHRTSTGACFKSSQSSQGVVKTSFHLNYCQDLVQTVNKQNTGN